MIEILITLCTSLICYLLGINYGKQKEQNKTNEVQITNVKKSTTIDNYTDSDIDKLYDKYE